MNFIKSMNEIQDSVTLSNKYFVYIESMIAQYDLDCRELVLVEMKTDSDQSQEKEKNGAKLLDKLKKALTKLIDSIIATISKCTKAIQTKFSNAKLRASIERMSKDEKSFGKTKLSVDNFEKKDSMFAKAIDSVSKLIAKARGGQVKQSEVEKEKASCSGVMKKIATVGAITITAALLFKTILKVVNDGPSEDANSKDSLNSLKSKFNDLDKKDFDNKARALYELSIERAKLEEARSVHRVNWLSSVIGKLTGSSKDIKIESAYDESISTVSCDTVIEESSSTEDYFKELDQYFNEAVDDNSETPTDLDMNSFIHQYLGE